MAKYSPAVNIRVAIIEQNSVEREYLLALVAGCPGVTLSGAYSGLADALPALEEDLPNIVIADLEAPNDLAVTLLKQLHTTLPHASILVLSTEKDRDDLFQALEAGVSGWLQKPCTADQILRAIVILQEGGAVLSSPVARKILEYFHARGSSVDCLSPRERELLGLLGLGMQAAEIAEKLGLSRSTVRTHVRNMLQKLKAGSRTEAVAKYLESAGVKQGESSVTPGMSHPFAWAHGRGEVGGESAKRERFRPGNPSLKCIQIQRFAPSPDLLQKLDALPDRTLFQTKCWLDFIARTQKVEPVFLTVSDGQAQLGWFTGFIVKKGGFRILGSPFRGWTSYYLGFNLREDVSRAAAVRVLKEYAFHRLGCVHLELMDRNLTPEEAEVAGLKYNLFRTLRGRPAGNGVGLISCHEPQQAAVHPEGDQGEACAD